MDPQLNREVAIKIPRLTHGAAAAQRFLDDEARSVARLRHPNIVAVFEYGLDGDQAYIVYEFVPGATLGEVLRQGDKPLQTLIQWLAIVADALAYAANEGIVHRDISPTIS